MAAFTPIPAARVCRRVSQWQPAIEVVRGSCPQAKAWRRQMVLGPAAEFAVETPAEAEIDVPAGWQRRRVTRMRLPHPLA